IYINRKTFSDRLNTILAERELSQKQAAKLLHIAPNSLWRYLHGEMPNTTTIYLIAETFNISVDWLLGLSNERRKENNT
ncbi:MAG: helix-turn-helix domain-containing protein, partial [Ruminococcus flavefaciens]|nr:helix-turn-helix domain-containing protein [Ruminococcus flavefaciens]